MVGFQDVLSRATAKGGSDLLGVVMIAVDKQGNTILNNASGFQSLDEDAPPIDPDSTFVIASCTKIVTQIAALQCVERGLIKLDDAVGTLLPELNDMPIIHLNEGDNKDKEPLLYTQPKNKITLRHLLTHSSGLAYDTIPLALVKWRELRGEKDMSANTKPIPEGYAIPLVFEPGEGWSYGPSLDWAGLLIARLTKTSFENYLQENVFAPLGMKHTTFHPEKRPDLQSRFLQMVQRTPEGALEKSANPYQVPPPDECGGHGLYSRPSDFINIVGDIVKDNPVLFKDPSTCDLLFAPQFDEGSPAFEMMCSSRIVLDAVVGSEGVAVNHGLGGVVAMEDAPALSGKKGTLTWGGLPNLMWSANREKGVASFLATQLLPPADGKALVLGREFMKEVWRLVG